MEFPIRSHLIRSILGTVFKLNGYWWNCIYISWHIDPVIALFPNSQLLWVDPWDFTCGPPLKVLPSFRNTKKEAFMVFTQFEYITHPNMSLKKRRMEAGYGSSYGKLIGGTKKHLPHHEGPRCASYQFAELWNLNIYLYPHWKKTIGLKEFSCKIWFTVFKPPCKGFNIFHLDAWHLMFTKRSSMMGFPS